MLVMFRSKAAADVMMYEQHAKRILDLLGKDVKRGVITVTEMPAAIAKLEAEISESRRHPVTDDVRHDVEAHHGPEGDDHDHEQHQMVSFGTRAYPLLEMMRAAEQGGNDVMWGV